MHFLSQAFPYLDSQRSRWFWALFSGLFASLFLYLFNPFNISSWRFDFALANQFTIWSGGLLAIPVLLLSQFVLRPWFVKGTFNWGIFLLWLGMEIFFLSLLYFLIFGNQTVGPGETLHEYGVVLKHTFLVSMIPFMLAFLILRSLHQTPDPVRNTPAVREEKWVVIVDENQKEVLRVKEAQLLFFKSEDNYVAVHFVGKKQLQKKLIRTNLKKLNSELNPQVFIRTHRSYMVNIKRVLSAAPQRKGLILKLDHLAAGPLPVSSSYKDRVLAQMDQQAKS